MNLMLESEVRKLLRNELGQETYNYISSKLSQLKRVEAIPIPYIMNYSANGLHDDLYEQSVVQTMVERYRHSLNCGGENGEKQS